MRRLRILHLVLAVALLAAPALGQSPAPSPVASPASLTTKDLHAMVVGVGAVAAIGTGGDTFVSAFPISSGSWGSDYVTSSHAPRMGLRYGVTEDGKTYARAEPVVACSSQYHRIDAMVFRAAMLPNRKPMALAHAFELKVGDEVELLPWKEFKTSSEPSKGRILATRYLELSD